MWAGGEVGMSKKSYKSIQNRLYREIKRRIIAENQLLKPIQFTKIERKIETIKIKEIIPDYIEGTKENIEIIKSDMVNQIMKQLIENDYIKFSYFGKYHRIANDEEVMDVTGIEAMLHVVERL